MANDTVTLLSGIGGSQAYGLDTDQSDFDRYGVFLAPTRSILGIYPIQETLTQTAPDSTMHELGKFVRLAIKANPTILDLLYLEDYEVVHPAGQMLIDHRSMFLSKTVYKSFGGYARAQAQRLKNRGDSFSSDTRNRTAKHARHCFRLMRQGAELLQTRTMTLKVTNREELFALGEMPVDQIVERFEAEFARFDAVETSLPDEPDLDDINRMLLKIRETYG
jgi:predicted nucleotidyltransferase